MFSNEICKLRIETGECVNQRQQPDQRKGGYVKTILQRIEKR